MHFLPWSAPEVNETMLTRTLAFLTAVAVSACAGRLAPAAEEEKPFPQPGSRVPSSFSPLVINGNWKDSEGKPVNRHHSVVCRFGLKPVVLVFARDPKDDAVFDLLKKLEAKIDANQDVFLNGCAIFLSHDDRRQNPDAEAKDLIKSANDLEKLVEDLQERAKAAGLKRVLVGIDNPKGPKGYDIPKKVDVMVVLYHKFRVVASPTFERGGLDDKAITTILEAVNQMVAGIKKPAEPKKKVAE